MSASACNLVWDEAPQLGKKAIFYSRFTLYFAIFSPRRNQVPDCL